MEIILDNMPARFIEVDCESIRPRGLVCIHGPNYVNYFLLSGWSTEDCIIFRVDEGRDVREEVGSFLIVALSSLTVKIPEVGFDGSFDLIETFANLALSCFDFCYMIPRQSGSILLVEEGGVPIPCL